MTIMPKKGIPIWFRDATTKRATNPNLTLIQCLCAAGGDSKDECHNTILQMAVYCLCKEMKGHDWTHSAITQPNTTHVLFLITISIQSCSQCSEYCETTISINQNESPPRLKEPPNKVVLSFSTTRQQANSNLLP